MQKIKSLAAVFLALFILAAIPTQAFAAETHEEVATMHTHQWRLDHYDTTYIPIDDETHLKTVYPVYYCTVSGCTNSYLGNGASSTVSHTMSSYSYTETIIIPAASIMSAMSILVSSAGVLLAIGIITAAPVMGIASCPSLFSRF